MWEPSMRDFLYITLKEGTLEQIRILMVVSFFGGSSCVAGVPFGFPFFSHKKGG